MPFIKQSSYFENRVVVISLNGVLDSHASTDFENSVHSLLGRDITLIILDAENISYVSSEGIGSLIYLAKKISAQRGELIIAAPSFELSSLFHLLRFDRSIITTPTVNKALEILNKKYLHEENSSLIADQNIIEIDEQDYPKDFEEISELNNHNTLNSNEEYSDKMSDILDHGEDNYEKHFASPLIVECTECGALIRMHKSGSYLCPSCHVEVNVKSDGTVIF